MTHICVGNLTLIGSDNGLSLDRRQCWNIVNWTHRNKLQWNVNRNSYIFIQEKALESVVWEITAIMSRPQCVNKEKCEAFCDVHWQNKCYPVFENENIPIYGIYCLRNNGLKRWNMNLKSWKKIMNVRHDILIWHGVGSFQKSFFIVEIKQGQCSYFITGHAIEYQNKFHSPSC